jgi:hypothetical protein
MKRNLKPLLDQEWINESARSGTVVDVRPFTFAKLCKMYGLHYRTLKKLLVPVQDQLIVPQGYYYTVRQIEIIYDFMGPPPYQLKENEDLD